MLWPKYHLFSVPHPPPLYPDNVFTTLSDSENESVKTTPSHHSESVNPTLICPTLNLYTPLTPLTPPTSAASVKMSILSPTLSPPPGGQKYSHKNKSQKKFLIKRSSSIRKKKGLESKHARKQRKEVRAHARVVSQGYTHA